MFRHHPLGQVLEGSFLPHTRDLLPSTTSTADTLDLA